MTITQPAPSLFGKLLVNTALAIAVAIDRHAAAHAEEPEAPEAHPAPEAFAGDDAGQRLNQTKGLGVGAAPAFSHEEREWQRRSARETALHMVLGGQSGYDRDPERVIAAADAFYGFIIDGTPPKVPTLADWSTEDLVRELSARTL